MPGHAYPETATESNSARPQSAGLATAEPATAPTSDQRVCERRTPPAPQSAPADTPSRDHLAWRLIERGLQRLETWDNPRPTRAEIMDYARTGPYTLPTTTTKDAKGNAVRNMTLLRRGGILYARLVATNMHSVLYALLWALRRPSRALAKTRRPTLEDVYVAVRSSSGPAQWVNVLLLGVHTAAYTVSWIVERPSRAGITFTAINIFRFALGFGGL